MIAPVVDFRWLDQNRDHVVLVDSRWYLDGRSAAEAYRRGHIPGAIFIGLDTSLSGEPGPKVGRHPLPTPERFAKEMSSAGIGDDSIVVAYDDAGGVMAARLVWMLRAVGIDAALLDGGLLNYSGALRVGQETKDQTTFTPRPWPHELLATIDEASDLDRIVLDARNRDRFEGIAESVDPRAGHIPGALNVPCRENLNKDGTFLPASILRERFSAAGVGDASQVISYCGSGVTACHNLLALEHAGFGKGRLFPGSWSQYSQDLERPVAIGKEEIL